MVLLDEVHTVAITIDGVTQNPPLRALLCGDTDTVTGLRTDATGWARNHPSIGHQEVEAAFSRAFDDCERIPGDGARGSAEGPGFAIEICRTIE